MQCDWQIVAFIFHKYHHRFHAWCMCLCLIRAWNRFLLQLICWLDKQIRYTCLLKWMACDPVPTKNNSYLLHLHSILIYVQFFTIWIHQMFWCINNNVIYYIFNLIQATTHHNPQLQIVNLSIVCPLRELKKWKLVAIVGYG